MQGQNQSDQEVSYPVGNQVFYHLIFGKDIYYTKFLIKNEKYTQKEDKLLFETKILGKTADVSLFLKNDTLYSYKYLIREAYNLNEMKYLADFDSIKSILTANYLHPLNELHTWKENCEEKDSLLWANAIANGCLTHSANWQIPDRSIALKLLGAGSRLMLIIEFKWIKPDKEENLLTESPEKLGKFISEIEGNPITVIYEQMPLAPGCKTKEETDRYIQMFIAKNLIYPEEAREKNIQGKVYASFVVEKTGEIGRVTIESGVDPALDAEAIRVLQSMPKFTPGYQAGEPVAVGFRPVINFRLGR